MSMAEFEKLVVEFGVPKDQTTQVLQALNRCGEVVYLGDKEKNSSLADISVYHSCFIHFFNHFVNNNQSILGLQMACKCDELCD